MLNVYEERVLRITSSSSKVSSLAESADLLGSDASTGGSVFSASVDFSSERERVATSFET